MVPLKHGSVLRSVLSEHLLVPTFRRGTHRRALLQSEATDLALLERTVLKGWTVEHSEHGGQVRLEYEASVEVTSVGLAK